MSPNDVEVLLHYHRSREPHERLDAPAVREATDRFLEARLIIPRDDSQWPNAYALTEGGEAPAIRSHTRYPINTFLCVFPAISIAEGVETVDWIIITALVVFLVAISTVAVLAARDVIERFRTIQAREQSKRNCNTKGVSQIKTLPASSFKEER